MKKNYEPLACCTSNLISRFQSDLESAQELLERGIRLNSDLFGPNDIRVASAQQALSVILNQLGQPLRALPLLESALETFEGLGAPTRSTVRASLAQVLDSLGRLEEAEPHYRLQLEEIEANLSPGHQRIATSQIYLGSFLCRRGRPQEGAELIAAALDNWTANLGAEHGATHMARSWLGILPRSRGEFERREGLAGGGSTRLRRTRCDPVLDRTGRGVARRTQSRRGRWYDRSLAHG